MTYRFQDIIFYLNLGSW